MSLPSFLNMDSNENHIKNTPLKLYYLTYWEVGVSVKNGLVNYKVSNSHRAMGLKEGKKQKCKWIFPLSRRTGNEPSLGIFIQILIILAKTITGKGMKAKEENELHC